MGVQALESFANLGVDNEQFEDEDQQSSYRPESPFLPEPEYNRMADATPMISNLVMENKEATTDSPFIAEYEFQGSVTESRESALHREIMEDLYDQEFEEALADLVNNVKGVHADRYQGELDHGSMEAEQQMWSYLAPLDQQISGAIDSLVEGLTQIDNEALTEEQLDNYLEGFVYETEFEEPEFDEFFKKIWKKVKKVAKKGLKVLKKLSPIHMILGKLKKLVRPLLKRVLKFALNKVPARFRPLAKKLARRFFKGALGEIDESELDRELDGLQDFIEQSELEGMDSEASLPSPAVLAAEFDSLIAGYVLDGEDYEFEPFVQQYLNEESFEGEYDTANFDKARDRFVNRINSAESEEEIVAEIEQFIPAILAGLKIGIKLIGRKRVVNFLAKLVAKLIRRFVGKQAATPLSRALVDAGLRLVSLETPEELERASADIVANTIQETIDEFVSNASDEVLDDNELTEFFVHEAFEHAVARNFPPQLIRTRLRQAPKSKGVWLSMPQKSKSKRYKKFSETFEVKISAQMAKQVRTFGGQNLYSFLNEQLGLPISKKDVVAKLHVYEGIRGTSLSDISHFEKGIQGLGSRSRSAWMKIHPLTRRAASVLIPKHVGLGRRVHRRFLANPTKTATGQRFYYLEIPGARVLRTAVRPIGKVGSRRPQKPKPARASNVNITLDFKTREIRIYNFLSEAKSTEIAQKIRAKKSRVAIVCAVKETLSGALKSILSGSPGNHIRIKREAQAEEGMIASLAPVLRFVGDRVAKRLTEFVTKELLKSLKAQGDAFAGDFIKAAESPEDGVTVILVASKVAEVFDAFSKNPIRRIKALAELKSKGITGSLKVSVKPGFHRE